MGFAWKRRGEGLSERSADSSVLLTPFSSAHPHLLKLNQGWAAQPFISLVSSGCLFHLTSSRGHRPFFSDLSSLSQSKTLSGTPKVQDGSNHWKKTPLRLLQHPLPPPTSSEAGAPRLCFPPRLPISPAFPGELLVAKINK